MARNAYESDHVSILQGDQVKWFAHRVAEVSKTVSTFKYLGLYFPVAALHEFAFMLHRLAIAYQLSETTMEARIRQLAEHPGY